VSKDPYNVRQSSDLINPIILMGYGSEPHPTALEEGIRLFLKIGGGNSPAGLL
jgi:hypothetical protein